MLTTRHNQTNYTKNFSFEITQGDRVIGSGFGPTKKIAKENAAQKAYEHLLGQGKIQSSVESPEKTYVTRLKELKDKNKIDDYDLNDIGEAPTISRFKVVVGELIYTKESQTSIEEAREKAYREAFRGLLAGQQTNHTSRA